MGPRAMQPQVEDRPGGWLTLRGRLGRTWEIEKSNHEITHQRSQEPAAHVAPLRCISCTYRRVQGDGAVMQVADYGT